MRRLLSRMRTVGDIYRWDGGMFDRAVARLRRPLDRAFLARAGAHSDLRRLVGEAHASNGQRVLVLALRAMPDHNAHEAVLVEALRRRGAEVAMLTCGGGLPLCEVGWARRAYPRPCDRCAWTTGRLATGTGVRHYRLADHLPWGANPRGAPADAASSEKVGDTTLDELTAITLAWFLRTSELSSAPEASPAAADLRVGSAGIALAIERVLDDFKPNVILALNGLFAAEQTICEVAAQRDIRVTTYEFAPRAGRLVFSNGAPAPDYDSDELWRRIGGEPLTSQQREEAVELLAARRRQVGHVRYFDEVEDDEDELRRRLEIPPGARVVSLFTNLSWDSATLFKELAYPSIQDWLIHAVTVVAGLPDRVLVVRIHPAEDQWRTRERLGEILLAHFGGTLPRNVRLVHSHESLSSYALMDISELVLAYSTTAGLEAAAAGRPVALAARTHYRNRGFTFDLESPDDLERLLAGPPPELTASQRDRALKYAWGFFFQLQLPFPPVRSAEGRVLGVGPAEQLGANQNPYVDFVCDRILEGGAAILPEELAA